VTDALIRGAGAAVAVWGAVVLALYGVFMTPVRVGDVLVPVALVLAIAGNALLMRFARTVTGSRLFALVPGAIWIVITFVAAGRTTEGDLVLFQSNWVATAYLFVGSATVTVMGYRIVSRPPPPPPVEDPRDHDAGVAETRRS
jgi:hypothetical protein